MNPRSLFLPEKTKAQCQMAMNNLEQENRRIDEQINQIDRFVSDNKINSRAMTAIRHRMEDYKLVLQTKQCANEQYIADCQILCDIAGDAVLRGDVVIKQRNAKNRRKTLERQRQQLITMQMRAPIAMREIYTRRIRMIEVELERLQDIIEVCQVIIDSYDRIEAETAALFSDGDEVRMIAENALNAIEVFEYEELNTSALPREMRLQMTQCAAEGKFRRVMQNEFGFDAKTAKIMMQVYQNIQVKYGDDSQTERDWRFVRSISQLSYNEQRVLNVYETYGWMSGAGSAYAMKEKNKTKLEIEQEYFCDTVGLSESDYLYLRQMVRFQNMITSNPEEYGIDEMNKAYRKRNRNPKFNEWKQTMENGIGREFNSSEEFRKYYVDLCDEMDGKGDLAHMAYTMASGIMTEDGKYNISNEYNIILEPSMSWHSAEERFMITGWLGDAVHVADGTVSFGEDDYIADLDANNIVYRMRKGGDLLSNFAEYYDDLSKGDANILRTREFLSTHPYEEVERIITERKTLYMNEIHTDGLGAYSEIKPNETFEDTIRFLERLKSVEEMPGEAYVK